MMLKSENILLRRFVKTGDAKAFSEIVRRHAGLVYGACLRVLEDRDRAADAVQETFFQLLRNAGEITGSVPSWLHRVATCKSIDAIRKDSSRRRREAEYLTNQPRETAKWQDISPHVDEALNELDEEIREILMQHFFQGRSMRDIANGIGISQPTVSRRIESGVVKLRERLKKRGIIVAVATLVGLLGENAVQAAPAVVLKELGKMALVGGPAALSGVGSAAAASGTGAKAAVGAVMTGVKAKIVTAAAVTAVGVGGVVTYNHVTRPIEPVDKPVTKQAKETEWPNLLRPANTSLTRRSIQNGRTVGELGKVTTDVGGGMQNQHITSSNPTQPAGGSGSQKESSGSNFWRQFAGGYSSGPIVDRPVGDGGTDEPDSDNSDTDTDKPMGYGGYGGYGGGYGGIGGVREDPNSVDDDSSFEN